MPTPTTLEDAQSMILDLQQRLTEVETERDSLSQNNAQLSADLARVRTKNQEYFEKLSSYYSPTPDKPNEPEKEVESCEEFAAKLTI